MVRPERFELPACCSGGNRSIQLSYGRVDNSLHRLGKGLNSTLLECYTIRTGDIPLLMLKANRKVPRPETGILPDADRSEFFSEGWC
jgi:hypothetical protein